MLLNFLLNPCLKTTVFSDYYFYGIKGCLIIKNLGHETKCKKLVKNKYYKGYYQLSDNIKRVGRLRSFMGAATNHVVNC